MQRYIWLVNVIVRGECQIRLVSVTEGLVNVSIGIEWLCTLVSKVED